RSAWPRASAGRGGGGGAWAEMLPPARPGRNGPRESQNIPLDETRERARGNKGFPMSITGESAGVRHAVILAGGKATRLRPFTDDGPKAMVPVGGKPIVDWQLEWLAQAGCEHVVISCGYLAEVLGKHLADHSYPLSIEVAVESEPLGRGGAL